MPMRLWWVIIVSILVIIFLFLIIYKNNEKWIFQNDTNGQFAIFDVNKSLYLLYDPITGIITSSNISPFTSKNNNGLFSLDDSKRILTFDNKYIYGDCYGSAFSTNSSGMSNARVLIWYDQINNLTLDYYGCLITIRQDGKLYCIASNGDSFNLIPGSPYIDDCMSCSDFITKNSNFLQTISSSPSRDMVCTTNQSNGYCDQFSRDVSANCTILCNNIPLVNGKANNFWAISRMFNPTNSLDPSGEPIKSNPDPKIVCEAYGECNVSTPECTNSCQMIGDEYGSNFCPSNNEIIGSEQDITSGCFFNCWLPTLVKYNATKENQNLYDRYIISSCLTNEGKQLFDNIITQLTVIEANILNTLVPINSSPGAFNFLTSYISNIQQGINSTQSYPACSSGDISQQALFIEGLCTSLDPSFNAQKCGQKLNVAAGLWNNFLSAFLEALRDNLRRAICVFINQFIKQFLPELINTLTQYCGAVQIPLLLEKVMAILTNAESLFSFLQTNTMKAAYLISLSGSLYYGCIRNSIGLTLTYDAGYILGVLFNCMLGTCSLINDKNTINNNQSLMVGQVLVTTQNYNLVMDYDGYLKIRQGLYNVVWQVGGKGGNSLKLDSTGVKILDATGATIISMCPGISNPQSIGIYPNGQLIITGPNGTQVWNNTLGCSGHGNIYWDGTSCTCKCDPNYSGSTCNVQMTNCCMCSTCQTCIIEGSGWAPDTCQWPYCQLALIPIDQCPEDLRTNNVIECSGGQEPYVEPSVTGKCAGHVNCEGAGRC